MKKVGILKDVVQNLIKEATEYLPSRYIERVIEKLRQNQAFKICQDETEKELVELRKNYAFVGTEKQLKRLVNSVRAGNTYNLLVAKAMHEVAMEEKSFIQNTVPEMELVNN